MEVHLKALTLNDKKVFRDLLGSSDFGGCFCAVWTSYGGDWEKNCEDASQPNFFKTIAHLERGNHIGFLVYSGSELVGWTGSGPKTSFPLLKTKLGSRLSEFSEDIWSIGCLAISSKFRGKNLSEKIVQAICVKAEAMGAKSIEAYPVRPFHEPRMYRGSHKLYERLGFVEVGFEKDGDFEILLQKFDLIKK